MVLHDQLSFRTFRTIYWFYKHFNIYIPPNFFLLIIFWYFTLAIALLLWSVYYPPIYVYLSVFASSTPTNIFLRFDLTLFLKFLIIPRFEFYNFPTTRLYLFLFLSLASLSSLLSVTKLFHILFSPIISTLSSVSVLFHVFEVSSSNIVQEWSVFWTLPICSLLNVLSSTLYALFPPSLWVIFL